MNVEDIKYIAFEGGGGKGIVYLGAVRALEKAGKLPLALADRDPEKSESKKRLDGIAGSSAGAITVYFLALGMNADAIDVRTRETDELTGKSKFFGFYDNAQPGLYKGIHYRPGEGNVPTYVVDAPEIVREPREGFEPGTTSMVATEIKTLRSGQAYVDRSAAQATANKLYSLYKFIYPLGALKLATRALGARRKLKKAMATNQVAEKLSEVPGDLNKYVYSLMFDRGLFSGINLRDYLHAATVEELRKNFGKELSLEAAARLTYRDFYEITNNDLRIAGTNITLGVPVYFSRHLTPDFPIVDSICMSMSIPFAFKSTLLEAWVDMERPRDALHNLRYRGFFNDAGILNNLPIHAFDFEGRQDNFENGVANLHKGMFGVRCTGGQPTDREEDPGLESDPLYICYSEERAAKATAQKKKKAEHPPPPPLHIDMAYGAFSPLIDFAGKLYNTLMYTSEEGQIRAANEFAQTTELFSYDVGLFDFTIPETLSAFVQARAAIKLGAMIQIPEADIEDLVLKYYKDQKVDTAEVKKYIIEAYVRAKMFRRKHGIL